MPAKVDVAVEDAAVKKSAYTSPLTASGAIGVDVPIPRRKFVLSQKNLELFCEKSPPAPMKGIDPKVSPER